MLVTAVLLAVVAASSVYCVLTVIASQRYLRVRPPELITPAPISILKPLSGAEDGLEQNLRSFFVQQYPEFEILFAARHASDPAVPVVKALQAEFPQIASRLIITGEPPYPNAKVYSLDRMKTEARYELLVMSDSDIRVEPHMLRIIAAEFQDPTVGIATCPYRAVPGLGLWSRLEAIGMNTHFLGGVLVARMLEGMKFAVGPTIAARKGVLDQIGGFNRLKDYLAEDFVMGKFADQLGHRVILSSYRIQHHIGNQPFLKNMAHRLRWARSTRRSRPKGYIGELFTNPLPPALLLCLWQPLYWPVLVIAIALRAWSAWAVAGWVLADPLTRTRWWLLPVQDLLACAVWLCGFFGNKIVWRGRQYNLRPDGRFELVG